MLPNNCPKCNSPMLFELSTGIKCLQCGFTLLADEKIPVEDWEARHDTLIAEWNSL